MSHVTEFLFHLKIMPSFTCKTSHGKEVALTPVIPASWGGRESHGIPWSQKKESEDPKRGNSLGDKVLDKNIAAGPKSLSDVIPWRRGPVAV